MLSTIGINRFRNHSTKTNASSLPSSLALALGQNGGSRWVRGGASSVASEWLLLVLSR